VSARKRAGSVGARLWAPWRMTYIKDAHEPTGCLFCRVWKSKADRKNLVLARGEHALLMLNRYPYNTGHLMVAVARHAGSFRALTAAERDDVMRMIVLAERALEAEYQPHGMNVGANLGRVAGAGFPGHLHVHLVPRWNGDTNFMPVIGETKVIPEAPARTWSRLKAAIRGMSATARVKRARAKRRRRGGSA
jgi:ATP adenylyltransferase